MGSSIIPAHVNQLYSAESAMLTIVAEGSTCVCVLLRKDDHVYLQKLLKPQYKDDVNLRNAMRKEWEIGQSMSSPYFVKYYELVDEGGLPYLLMDYVDGGTVKDLLSADKPWFLDRENLQKLFVQLLEGLKYLHQQQVVHLDLSLTNIMLTNVNHDVRIIDLGYCYSPSHLSVIGTTHAYSAPELYDKTLRIDARADIYSVGRIILDIIDAAYPDSADKVSDIKKIAQKCCRPNREDRYSSADEAIKAFAEFKQRRAKRRRLVWLFVAVTAIVGTALVWLQNREDGTIAVDSTVVSAKDTLAAPIIGDTATKPADSMQSVASARVDTVFSQTEVTVYPDNAGQHYRMHGVTTISDPGYSLGGYVSPTDDKSSIPFTITLKNRLGINEYQVDVILPSEECAFVRQSGPNSAFLKNEEYRLPDRSRAYVCYQYKEADNGYIILQGIDSIDEAFVGTSGKVLTIYFDGSSLPDGSYYVIMHSGLMHHFVDHQTVEHYASNQKLIYFTISQGKVTPGR